MIKLNLRLILIFLEISVIPLFLISYLAVYHAKKMVTEGTLIQMEQVVSINKSKLSVLLGENKRVIQRVATEGDIKQATASAARQKTAGLGATLNKVLDEEKNNVDGLSEIFVVDSKGDITYSGGEIEKNKTGDEIRNIASGIKKDEYRQKFILDDQRELQLIALKKIGGEGDSSVFSGIVRNGDSILTQFENNIGFGNSFEFILAEKSKDGSVIFVTPSRFDQSGALTKTTPGDDFSQSTTMAILGQERRVEDSIDWRGKHVLSVTRYLDETGWGLVAKKDQDETYLPIYKLTSLLFVIAIVAVAIIVLISLSSATSIVAPIKRLINITAKISGGDLSQRALVESKDEIGLLEISFNQMASKIKEYYGNLENKVAERTKELETIRKNLEVANANLRELDKLKDEFVSVASHELRTPMTAIRGLISMIFEGDYGPVNENLKAPLSDISKSTQRLIVLVNDILNVSRIETGKLKVALTFFDIGPVIDEMGEQLMPIAIEKGLTLSIVKGEPSMVQADKDKVREILNNLIGNALKFTDTGGVSVSWSADADEVKVFIKDSGIGITPEGQLKLFGKFRQITTQQVGKPSGSGLGLYISRELARKMGGELWIEASRRGQGSVFAFSLPSANSAMARMVAEKLAKENKAQIESNTEMKI